jgi:hypothetical protein
MEMMRRAAPRGVQTRTTNRPSKSPGGDEAPLTIIAPRIFKRGVQPSENLRCVSKIQTPLGLRFRALG